jgi:maltooligosyltrehalose synthase
VVDPTVPAGLVGFARRHDDTATVFLAPRLCATIVSDERQVPLGGECWKTSRVLLPPELAGRTFRHEITGAEIKPVATDSGAWVFVGQVFETVPVGILRAV